MDPLRCRIVEEVKSEISRLRFRLPRRGESSHDEDGVTRLVFSSLLWFVVQQVLFWLFPFRKELFWTAMRLEKLSLWAVFCFRPRAQTRSDFKVFFSLVIIFSRANERFFAVSRGLARVQWSYPLGEITLHSMMGPRSVRAGGREGMAYRKMIDGTRWKEIAF